MRYSRSTPARRSWCAQYTWPYSVTTQTLPADASWGRGAPRRSGGEAVAASGDASCGPARPVPRSCTLIGEETQGGARSSRGRRSTPSGQLPWNRNGCGRAGSGVRVGGGNNRCVLSQPLHRDAAPPRARLGSVCLLAGAPAPWRHWRRSPTERCVPRGSRCTSARRSPPAPTPAAGPGGSAAHGEHGAGSQRPATAPNLQSQRRHKPRATASTLAAAHQSYAASKDTINRSKKSNNGKQESSPAGRRPPGRGR